MRWLLLIFSWEYLQRTGSPQAAGRSPLMDILPWPCKKNKHAMKCPICHQTPISFHRFLLSRHVFKITCDNCNIYLRANRAFRLIIILCLFSGLITALNIERICTQYHLSFGLILIAIFAGLFLVGLFFELFCWAVAGYELE